MIGVPLVGGLVMVGLLALYFVRWRRSKNHDDDVIAPDGPTHWLDEHASGDPFGRGEAYQAPPVRFYGSTDSKKKNQRKWNSVGSINREPFDPQPLSSPPLINPFILQRQQSMKGAARPEMQQTASMMTTHAQKSASDHSIVPVSPFEDDNAPSNHPGASIQRDSSHSDSLAAVTEAALQPQRQMSRQSAASSVYAPTAHSSVIHPSASSDEAKEIVDPALDESVYDNMYASLTRASIVSSNSSHHRQAL